MTEFSIDLLVLLGSRVDRVVEDLSGSDSASSVSRDCSKLGDRESSNAMEGLLEVFWSSSVEAAVGALLRLRAQRGAEPPS